MIGQDSILCPHKVLSPYETAPYTWRSLYLLNWFAMVSSWGEVIASTAIYWEIRTLARIETKFNVKGHPCTIRVLKTAAIYKTHFRPLASDWRSPLYFSLKHSFSDTDNKLSLKYCHLFCEKEVRSRIKCSITSLHIIQFLINYLSSDYKLVNLFFRCSRNNNYSEKLRSRKNISVFWENIKR